MAYEKAAYYSQQNEQYLRQRKKLNIYYSSIGKQDKWDFNN